MIELGRVTGAALVVALITVAYVAAAVIGFTLATVWRVVCAAAGVLAPRPDDGHPDSLLLDNPR